MFPQVPQKVTPVHVDKGAEAAVEEQVLVLPKHVVLSHTQRAELVLAIVAAQRVLAVFEAAAGVVLAAPAVRRMVPPLLIPSASSAAAIMVRRRRPRRR